VQITQLKRTCIGCPAQWEGHLDDGSALYVRYRHGRLFAGAGPSINDAIWPDSETAAAGSRVLIERIVGHDMDGFLTDHELRDHLAEADITIAPGLIADPCTEDHDDLDIFGCQVCGQPASAEAVEAAMKRMHDLFDRLAKSRQAKS
jgi:hypothetical protein